jgi:3-hydroxyacyl-[acyl-carrier-protein] dehydratase
MLYNKEDIKRIIPHREPMLMVDSILDITINSDGKKVIRGEKTFLEDEAFFKGHFPDCPIVPGVLLIEAIAQVGAVSLLSMEEYKGHIAFLVGADHLKWKRNVLPKDKILIQVTEEKVRHGLAKAFGEAYIKDELVCSLEITSMVR